MKVGAIWPAGRKVSKSSPSVCINCRRRERSKWPISEFWHIFLRSCALWSRSNVKLYVGYCREKGAKLKKWNGVSILVARKLNWLSIDIVFYYRRNRIGDILVLLMWKSRNEMKVVWNVTWNWVVSKGPYYLTQTVPHE